MGDTIQSWTEYVAKKIISSKVCVGCTPLPPPSTRNSMMESKVSTDALHSTTLRWWGRGALALIFVSYFFFHTFYLRLQFVYILIQILFILRHRSDMEVGHSSCYHQNNTARHTDSNVEHTGLVDFVSPDSTFSIY